MFLRAGTGGSSFCPACLAGKNFLRIAFPMSFVGWSCELISSLFFKLSAFRVLAMRVLISQFCVSANILAVDSGLKPREL